MPDILMGLKKDVNGFTEPPKQFTSYADYLENMTALLLIEVFEKVCTICMFLKYKMSKHIFFQDLILDLDKVEIHESLTNL